LHTELSLLCVGEAARVPPGAFPLPKRIAHSFRVFKAAVVSLGAFAVLERVTHARWFARSLLVLAMVKAAGIPPFASTVLKGVARAASAIALPPRIVFLLRSSSRRLLLLRIRRAAIQGPIRAPLDPLLLRSLALLAPNRVRPTFLRVELRVARWEDEFPLALATCERFPHDISGISGHIARVRGTPLRLSRGSACLASHWLGQPFLV